MLLIQRYSRIGLPLLIALFGLATGHLAATAVGLLLRPSVSLQASPSATPAAADKPLSLGDFDIIVQRNIFDSSSRRAPPLASSPRPKPLRAGVGRGERVLLGTVAGGTSPLAVIRAGDEIGIFRLGQELPGGGQIRGIERNLVHIQSPDGSVEVLPLFDGQETAGDQGVPAAPAGGGGHRIRSVGENRWAISREAAERARSNIDELLKTARMVPNVVDGRTSGFTVTAIRPRSFLAGVGLRKGDVVVQVNGLELNSPEKALQVFQQLREARNISIDLLRGGQRLTFDYEIN